MQGGDMPGMMRFNPAHLNCVRVSYYGLPCHGLPCHGLHSDRHSQSITRKKRQPDSHQDDDKFSA